jgi:LacI family transcriptional regulator
MYETRRIGLAIDAVASYGRGVIRGIMAYCKSNPRWIIAVEPHWSFSILPAVEHWDVDGILVQTFSRTFEEEVLHRKLPAANVSNFCNGGSRIPTVIPDDLAVGRLAADYLLSLGFRDLGFCWPGDSEYGRLRLESFREHALAGGATVHECNASEQDINAWLPSLPRPAAILGCNDDWAHRILNIARRNGIRVPDELAVLGVDDDELFNTLVSPSLSSIALPAEQIGFQAAALLDRIMDGYIPGPEPIHLPPVRVVPRESTDVLSVDDPDVALAIRFIREHATRPLQVDDILEHVLLSRRSLERRFRRAIGRSISAEIRRAHIERAKTLLISTDLSMPQIATAAGFTTATRLGIVFQKEVGEAPTEFRRRARIGGRAPKLDAIV